MELNTSADNFVESKGDNAGLLAATVIFSLVWTLFCVILWPKIQGILLTMFIRLVYKKAYISVGSLKLCPLAGCAFFKNIVYADEDNSFRALDGYISIPWWIKPRAYPDPSKPGNVVKSNLFTVKLNGFHYHWYNRDEAYKVLEKKFNDTYSSPEEGEEGTNTEQKSGVVWYDYVPVLQFLFTKGSLTFGNSNVPHSLVVVFEEATATHTITAPYNQLDERLNTTVFETIDVNAYIQKSAGYNSAVEEPPVSDAKGFLFAESSKATFTYSIDVPGVMDSDEFEMLGPRFLFNIEAGAGTKVNYGPWVHRQRFYLQRLFVPHDYTEEPVTVLPTIGQRRIFTNLDVVLSAPRGAELNVTFKEGTSVSELKLVAGEDSRVVVNQPWITHEDGYTSVIKGFINSPRFTTSMPYPRAAEGHCLQFSVKLHFPRRWNDLQKWDMQFSAERMLCTIMIHYVDFFDALLRDWWGDDPSDFKFFVPIKWTVGFSVKNYEIYVPTNRYNWMDISPRQMENSSLAFCGESGQLSFEFPLMEFMPLEQKVDFQAQGENLVLRKYLPPSCSTKQSVFNLSSANRRRWRPLDSYKGPNSTACNAPDSDYERFPLGCCISTHYEDGWLDLGAGRGITLEAHYVSKRNDNLDGRIPQGITPPPNTVNVIVQIDKPILRVFGSLAKEILAIKENFVGDYPYLNTFNSEDPNGVIVRSDYTDVEIPKAPTAVSQEKFSNVFPERFLNIHVDFKITNITAEFPLHPTDLNDDAVPLPSAFCSCFNLLADYELEGTHITLKIEKLSLLVPGKLKSEDDLGQVGSVCFPGIELQAQGYTEPLHHQRVEYAWMIAVSVQDVSGSLGIHQVPLVMEWFESAALHAISPGDSTLEAPGACVIAPKVEPLSEDLKYKLLNVYLHSINVDLFSNTSYLLLKTPGFVLHVCSLQTEGYEWSVSGCLQEVQILGLMAGEDQHLVYEYLNATLKGLSIESRICGEPLVQRQMNFIRTADRRTQRLWFLWPDLMSCGSTTSSCGCELGCQFTSIFQRELVSKQHSIHSRSGSSIDQDTSNPSVFPSSDDCTVLCLNDVRDIAKIHYWLLEIPDKGSSPQQSIAKDSSFLMPSLVDDSVKRWSSPSIESFYSVKSHISDNGEDVDHGVPLGRDSIKDDLSFLPSFFSSHYSTVVSCSFNGINSVGCINVVRYRRQSAGLLPTVRLPKRRKMCHKSTHSDSESNALISIQFTESLTLTFFPGGFRIVESFIDAFGNALASQAAPSCLNLDMLVTVLGLSSLVAAADPVVDNHDRTTTKPILCVAVETHEDAFCSVQMNGFRNRSGIDLATLYAMGINGGILVKSSLPPSSHDVTLSDNGKVTHSAYTVAVSLGIPTIQLDFSTVQPGVAHGDGKPSQYDSDLLAFSWEFHQDHSLLPLFQLSIDKVLANLVGSVKKSQQGCLTLTFTDIFADDDSRKEFYSNSESNVSLLISFCGVRSQFVHSLTIYPNVLKELSDLCRQFNTVPAVAQSVHRVVGSVSHSRRRGLYQLLFSATSHSGRILPKVHCVHSPSTKALRDTAVYQCLQQLSAVTREISSPNPPFSKDSKDKDVIASLAAALSAKLSIMSIRLSHKRPLAYSVTSTRNHSMHSLHSQTSIHSSGATEKLFSSAGSRVPPRPEMSSNIYRKFFQKLGHAKLGFLTESLSPWLPGYFKKRSSSDSFTSFNVELSLPCVSVALLIPSLPSPIPVIEVTRVAAGICGKLSNNNPFTQPSEQKFNAQINLKVDNVAMCAPDTFDRFIVINVLQVLNQSTVDVSSVQPPSPEANVDSPQLLPQGGIEQSLNIDPQLTNEFASNILKYYRDTLSYETPPLDSVRPGSPNVIIPLSPGGALFNLNGSHEDLVPLVSDENVLSPTGGVANPGFLMTPRPDNSVEFFQDTVSSSSFDITVYVGIGSIGLTAELDTLKGKLQFEGITFSILSGILLHDASERSAIKKLSLSSTYGMKKAYFEFVDEGWNPSVLLKLSAPELSILVSIISQDSCLRQYQVLAHLPTVEFDLKQPPVVIQKVFHVHLPSFRALYGDIKPFLHLESRISPRSPQQKERPDFTMLNSMMKALGQGSCLIVVQKVSLLVTALPSLTLMYYGSSYVGYLKSNHDINVSFSCSSHNLKFTPRVHLEDISVRDVYLPSFDVGATFSPREHGALPTASLYLHINKVEIHLSTDIVNQLLVVQSSFVKELDETVSILGEIRHAVPMSSEPTKTKPAAEKQPGVAEPSDILISALQTLNFLVQGVDVTISTPSQTAVRLTTGKIEVLINNVQSASREYLLCLLGKVDIDVHLALGYFQDTTDDLDVFNELAQFSTRLSIRDTSQISDSGSDDQDLTPLDTYTLNIHSPHLFIQSAAVEKGLTFWLYCKVAYSYWQDQRKALQDEVQRATDSLLQRIHRRGESSVPKLDFARPKLVQITVTDLGFCFPLTANPIVSDMRPRAMPAGVVTIQEMKITINVRKKIAIAGSFAGFCARFSEWFTARQKHWSVDFRRREVDNCATVPKGTCKICIGIKTSPGSHRIRLIWSLQWDMSGIDIHAKYDIGSHISSLVRTIFSVTGDIDKAEAVPSCGVTMPSVTISKPQQILERNLGLQAHHVQNLKQQGVEYSEELSTLKQMERVALRSMRSGNRSGPSKVRRVSVLVDWSRPTLLKAIKGPASPRPTSLASSSPTVSTHRRARSEIYTTETENNSKKSNITVGSSSELSDEKAVSSSTTIPNEDYSIDLDINVIVNIARGSLVLHSSSLPTSDFNSPVIPRRGMSDNSALFWSPSPSRVKRPKEPIASTLSGSIPKVHIPAFDVKANYSSDVIKGLGDETTSMDSFTESQLREGKLMISVSVESLEKEVVLTPSLPLFVEQVVQPISTTLDLSSQQNVSVDPDSSEDHSDTSSITIAETSSFPIHVFIHFHLKPSTIILSCEPVSRVHCKIGIPDVHVACSFSLFTVKENDSSLSSGLDPQISTLNDLSVTGCLSAFSISVISPQATSGVFQKLQKTGATKGPRFVFSLKLGLASIHLSRKTLVAETNGVVHDKQYISIAADVASVLLGFDIRQLNNATAFRKCWYKKGITESILFGQGSSRSINEVKSVNSNPLSASIIVAANISDLTFSSNLAQVMGDAGIVLTHFGIRSHADILENELVQLTAKVFVSNVNVDARGGVVAGEINISNAQIGLNTCSHEGKKPIHDANAQVECVHCRVDYMGASQLMAKASHLRFHICEQWKGSVLDSDSQGFPGVKIVVSFDWDSVKLIISQSTTRAIVNIALRLSEFILQQKSRSEKTILTMLPASASGQGTLHSLLGVKTGNDDPDRVKAPKEATSETTVGYLKYHHWLWATYERTSSLLLALGIYSPEAARNMSLGGEVHIRGGSVSLACLHGSSFIEKEWAVFNLQSLVAGFTTQAIPCLAEDTGRTKSVGSEEEQTRVCQQQLSLSLKGTEQSESSQSFAGIYKVTCGRAGLPLLSSNTNMDDWLSYRCIDGFFLGEDLGSSQKPAIKLGRRTTVEPILTVPSFSFNLTNDHFWPSSDSLVRPDHPIPLVKCHLRTNFKEGISITTFANRYDFLHKLITSYIEYLEDKTSDESSKPKPPFDKGGLDLHCGRTFVCETWELDPRLVLIAGEMWPSGKLNPRISLLLDWLGFKEAKVTIPKWVQRGAMDPIDLLFSKLLQTILVVSARKKTIDDT